MGKVKEYMESLAADSELKTRELAWIQVPHHGGPSDRDNWFMIAKAWQTIANKWEAEAEKLQRTVEGLGRQHEAEKTQMRAEFEAELARARADLARSEFEKRELQTELFDTRRDNGELEIENTALRLQRGGQPRESLN